jgi:pimeloyl-ACP methyl ester carboxylesterase
MGDDVRFVQANGLRFGYLESGSGPLVLLVHGFPDTAHTWDATRAVLAGAGFRAVAPFTRGYAPTEVPAQEAYDSDTLGRDLLAIIPALGAQSAVIVGHDWGASAAYSAAGIEPAAVRLLVTLAIPHPASITPTPGLIGGCGTSSRWGRSVPCAGCRRTTSRTSTRSSIAGRPSGTSRRVRPRR